MNQIFKKILSENNLIFNFPMKQTKPNINSLRDSRLDCLIYLFRGKKEEEEEEERMSFL